MAQQLQALPVLRNTELVSPLTHSFWPLRHLRWVPLALPRVTGMPLLGMGACVRLQGVQISDTKYLETREEQGVDTDVPQFPSSQRKPLAQEQRTLLWWHLTIPKGPDSPLCVTPALLLCSYCPRGSSAPGNAFGIPVLEQSSQELPPGQTRIYGNKERDRDCAERSEIGEPSLASEEEK